jgi:hypothetical protein
MSGRVAVRSLASTEAAAAKIAPRVRERTPVFDGTGMLTFEY